MTIQKSNLFETDNYNKSKFLKFVFDNIFPNEITKHRDTAQKLSFSNYYITYTKRKYIALLTFCIICTKDKENKNKRIEQLRSILYLSYDKFY